MDYDECCVPKISYDFLKRFGGKKILDVFSYSVYLAGEYPQTEVDKSLKAQLDNLRYNNNLSKTGKTYPINDSIQGDGVIVIRNLQEYEYNGQKYVLLPRRYYQSGCITEYDIETKWYKVEPIEWIKFKTQPTDEYVICKNALIGGFPFDNQLVYGRDFEHAYLHNFLNYEFKKAIIPLNQNYLNKFSINDEQVRNVHDGLARQYPNTNAQNKPSNPYGFTYEELNNDKLFKLYVQAGQSVFLHGPSGVGKSARVKQIDPTATRITLRPQMNPEEVDGTLNRETGEYIPPLWYTQLCNKCKAEPDRMHVLFIDELTNVKPTVQSLVYSIVLDRAGKDGLWPLPENSVVVGAGNENVDNLAAYPMTNALYRRFSHIYYEVDLNSWLQWATGVSTEKPVANAKPVTSQKQARIHPAILAFVQTRGQDVLNQELDEENSHIVTDPRKWEIASKVLYATNNPKALLPAIGEALTADFVAFTKSMQLTVDDVVDKNYQQYELRTYNFSQRVATIAGLTVADENELGVVREFIGENFGSELLATYDAMWVRNDPERALILQDVIDAQAKQIDEIEQNDDKIK